jgi:dienelactone hydrolase
MKNVLMQKTPVKEEAVLFGEKKSLAGIVTYPPGVVDRWLRPAVILLNPGIVHRAGPGRIYVKIARALAAIGYVVLRFDFSGIGDSAVRHDNLRFEKSAVRETQDAMEFLRATRGSEYFVLLGGCSGAQISFDTACCDPRTIGAILINYPVIEDEDDSADADLKHRRAAHYYWNFALFNRKSWGKLFSGRANYRQLMGALKAEARRRFAPRKAPRESVPFQANLRRLAERDVRLTFLCSQGDPLLDELREAGGNDFRRLCALGTITLDIIPRSDHTFSSLDDHDRLLDVILKRIKAMTPAGNISFNKTQIIPGSEDRSAVGF